MRPPSILFLHPSDEGYGADRILLATVLGLRRAGYLTTVLLPREPGDGWLSTRLLEQGIGVHRVELAVASRRRFRPRAIPGYVLALMRTRAEIRRWARTVGADAIHANTTAILAAALVGRPGGARLVWHVHELVVSPPPVAWLFRLLPPLTADRVIAISDAVRDHLTPWRRLRRRVVTVHNGLPRRLVPPPDAVRFEHPIVALVGRINRWKGQAVFVEAISAIASRFPEARFVIAGGPPPGEPERVDELRAQIAEAGLDARIELRGEVPDGAALFDTAAIAVAPSVWPEPFGLVVLEAMQSGCAVVATNHGGTTELIEPGRTGLLVPPADPAALAAALAALLADPAMAIRLGQAAQQAAGTSFSEEAMVAGIEAVYRDLLR
jgi:glycosyltransferase involved in cell wall biosynthesis